MKYGIGIDAGISSVGHAVMVLDDHDEPCKIHELNSRIFDQAENPKTGASLAAPRREKRGMRRTLRRKQHRKERIRYLLLNENILTQAELETLFVAPISDIYKLRFEGLERKLSNKEWARVLIHLAQRRGFKSNRKSENDDKEVGALLSAITDNESLMKDKGYRTVGEMFYKDAKYHNNLNSESNIYYTRNKAEEYKSTVSRAMVESEVHILFSAQREYGSTYATEKIEKKYCDILLSQRPFDLGPGKMPNGEDSPYGGNIIEKMIGNCTFFPEEKRASKATYSFMLFTLWQKINNIRITNGTETRKLNDAERNQLFDLAHNKKTLTLASIRKELSISDDWRFIPVSKGDPDWKEKEKKEKFEFLNNYHQIKTALDKYEKDVIKQFDIDQLDAIGTVFTIYKNDEKIIEKLKEYGIDEKFYESLLTLKGFSKFGHLSVKACRMILPYLEKGLTYDDACENAGIDFRGHSKNEKSKFLDGNSEELSDITNPVVKRSVSQIIKVINAIIREMGNSPTYVNIELARELSKTFDERQKIKKSNESGRDNNQKIVDEIKENFKIASPSGMDIVKVKLYHEQKGVCAYSLENLEYSRLLESGYAEVDHIKPYSISFDDSYANKVLVKTKENRLKSNCLPLEYLTGKRREDFIVWVNAAGFRALKKNNLLKEHFTEDDINGYKERNLNDTKYLNRVIYNYINDNLQFEEFSGDKKKHVHAISGGATAYMRKRWGISKIRPDGDLHHAVDAVVIACTTDGMLQKISRYSKYNEVKYADTEDGSFVGDRNGEVIDTFPFPYPTFRKELDAKTSNNPAQVLKYLNLPNYSSDEIDSAKPCFVSRMPKHKVKGAAHQDTVRSAKKFGYAVSKVELSKLKLKDGEIDGYYRKEDDALLYNALKERLERFGGDGKMAFPPDFEFHKPKSDGSIGPVVKKVKIEERASLNVPVRKNNGVFTGVAQNDSMVRIDVFHVENDGYYFVPIYVADTVKKQLPNKACVAFKDYNDWKEMKDSDFIFSLYPNDLVKITAKKDMSFTVAQKESTLPPKKLMNEVLVYYNSANISTASIKVFLHDHAYELEGLGIKTLKSIEKYTVDVLGNVYKVQKEKRQPFNIGKE